MDANCMLPDDLVHHHILSKLPVRDLLRCRCVCKDWCALIDSPSFIRNHYQAQYSISKLDGNVPHFVNDLASHCSGDLFLLSIQQGHVSTVDLNADLQRDCSNILPMCRDQCSVSTYGCVNGIILLKFCFDEYVEQNCLALWNPATRDFKSVDYPFAPGLSSHISVNGFGFDMISNDFKILGTHYVVGEGIYSHGLYSIRTNTWKQLSSPLVSDLPFSGSDGYLNGVYYWYGFPEDESEINCVIVTFDFSSEIYTVSDFPEDAKALIPGAPEITITLYKESIGLFISHQVQEKSLWYEVDIWVVTGFDECGVPLSWQHLFTVGPTLTKFYVEVSTTCMDGDLLLTYMYVTDGNCNVCGKEYLYNPSTTEFKYLADRIAYYYRYIESLFPLSNRLIES